ncbi:single-stranded DNA-binding protein [Corynebacterium aquilae]|uniref:single-stranded DNA-binding protein n=1 Tax=Corynebacterium aquilae TaxID=203263 RepID=UPI0009530C26|nr:single-stranded DNA-binding protein [Corynebacterium aquilae]
MALHSFTAVGMICSDPHYKQTAPNQGVTKFRLKATKSARTADGQWIEQDSLWLTVEAWGQLAENARRSLSKLMNVIVVGTLVTHEYDNERGEHRSTTVLKAHAIGPDLNRYLVPEPTPHGSADIQQREQYQSLDDQGLHTWIDSSTIEPRYNDRDAQPTPRAHNRSPKLTNHPPHQPHPPQLTAIK